VVVTSTLDVADGMLLLMLLMMLMVVGVKRFVVGTVAGVLALQEHVHLAERRPLVRLGPPALHHQVVDLSRTGARPFQQRRRRNGAGGGGGGGVVVVTPAVRNHVVVAQRRERTPPRQRQDLPERHRERPYVTLRRKISLHRARRTDSH